MKKISSCINPTLQKICQQAIEFEGLSERIYAYLPKAYHQHCAVGSFHKGRLTLVIKSPAIAAELRYLLPELRDNLRQKENLHHLISIQLTLKS